MKILIGQHKLQLELWFGFLILLGCVLAYFQLLSNLTTNYHPVWSDEFGYYINTQSFFENSTLKAAITLSGEGSAVFGADPHGFAYPLFHGCIAKIFGWSNLNFIITNFILLSASILMVWSIKSIHTRQKLWISSFILLFPFVPLYLFTYMQEIIHISVAIIVSVLIYLIYSKENNNTIYIVLFILTIFIAGCFRVLWFFWLIGLIPLAKDKRQGIAYLLLFAFGIIISFVFSKLFAEAVPNKFSSIIAFLKNGELKNVFASVYYNFIKNIMLYFFSIQNGVVYVFMKFTIFGAVLFFTFLAFRNKSRLNMALALIGIVNFVLLFFIYDAFDWREIRTMSALYYFYVLFIIIETKGVSRYIQALFLLVVFVLNYNTSKRTISERNFIDVPKMEKERMAYSEISQRIPNGKIVLLDYIPQDYSWDILNLPLKNSNNSAIRYIVQYYNVDKTNYDYILMRPVNNNTKSNKIIDNDYYILTKNE